MPSKKGYEVGDIVLLKDDKKMTSYRIMAKFDYFRTYMIKNCENPLDVIEVDEDQICHADKYDVTTYVEHDETHHIWQNRNTTLNDFYATIPDELLDDLAPPMDDSSDYSHDQSHAQEEYNMIYNAVSSVEHVLRALISCATSENKMSNAELLALRDKAEEFGNIDIVHAIDSHFDDGDD